MFQSAISVGDTRVFERLVAGLEVEFGAPAAEGLARQFVEAEDADFYWDARAAERWLGAYENLDDDEELLARVAITGQFEGRFFVAVLIVDGNEAVNAMLGLPHFESAAEVDDAFRKTR